MQKPAQVGATELALNKLFWAVDVLKLDVLYVLPTSADASDFSAGRMNPAIEESERLSALFTDVSNVGHKRAGGRSVYIRGSQKRSRLKSVPVDLLIIDEYDEATLTNIPLARARLDASSFKWELDLSTPTVPEYGIHSRFLESDKQEYYVKCPACNAWQKPTFQDNVAADAPEPYYHCAKCRRPVRNFWSMPGRWVAEEPAASLRGYRLSQLLSPTVTAAELVAASRKTAPEDVQEFYNSKLGEPFVVEGGQLTQQILDACRDSAYTMPDIGEHCTMGVDVGKHLHVRVSRWEADRKFAVHIGTVERFEDLDRLMARYNVDRCVIDALPETRKSQEFADRFPGRVWTAFYTRIDPAKVFVFNDQLRKVDVNRTLAMDAMFDRFLKRGAVLPASVAVIPDYYEQMRASVRIVVKDAQGRPVPRYVEQGKPDHYAHAETYDEIAGTRQVWSTADQLFAVYQPKPRTEGGA